MDKILQATCLKPRYTLRRQLLISFGVISFVSIGTVMLIATMTAKYAGENVVQEARYGLEQQVIRNLQLHSDYVADTVAKKFDNLRSAAAIVSEVTRDRIVGYPNDGYETDTHVPFFDTISQRNAYPLKMPLLPRDWNITPNVNESNFEEHVQERGSWYDLDYISTESSTYRFQGNCDPSQIDPSARTYHKNCTAENNNIMSGGAIQPTPTNRYLAEKAADISALLKPLYEMHNDVQVLGTFFSNSGAGSVVSFPAKIYDGTASYNSIGCNWMKEINPLTGLPLATSQEISRCHKENETVPSREYNPLERGWCRDQALNRNSFFGPYQDAFQKELWLMTYGKAVFDRKTGHFIGCTLLDISISTIDEILQSSVGASDDLAEIALVNFKDGAVISSSLWDTSSAKRSINIIDLHHFGIDESRFSDFQSKLPGGGDFKTIFEYQGRLISISPIPNLNDCNMCKPDFLIIQSIEGTVFQAVDHMDNHISDEIWDLIHLILIVGLFGLVLVISLIWTFSTVLTRPLAWMERAAKQIVNNANTTSEDGVDFDFSIAHEPMLKCTPKTEITHLVSEFRQMIESFSGEGASEVANSSTDTHEVKNLLTWKHEFDYLYKPDEEDCNLNQPSGMSSGEASKEDHNAKTNTSPSGNDKERVNVGSNISSEDEEIVKEESTRRHYKILDRNKGLLSSSLFWWVVGLIVIPLLVTVAAICSLASIKITRTFPNWLNDIDSTSVMLEKHKLFAVAQSRSAFAEEVMFEPIRDLYLILKSAGWLLFDGINRSNTFTETIIEAAEICKSYPVDGSCPFQSDCACEWSNSGNEKVQCYNYTTRSRYLQKASFLGQKQDADNSTGSRMNISSDASYPNLTSWWGNITEMPGYSKKAASGYKTTYDRVGVLSALAFTEFPVHNYERSSTSQKHIGSYVGIEADGSLQGWQGCYRGFIEGAHFQSTAANRAAVIGNTSGHNFCPLGKYGYDARCRDWYEVGKQKGTTGRGSGVHITPPYLFGTGQFIGVSATSPLIDPRSETYVGQALLDFLPISLGKVFNNVRDSDQVSREFHVIVTPETDAYGGDTVVGPGFHLGDSTGAQLGDLVLKFDNQTSKNRKAFDNDVTSAMRRGEEHQLIFTRAVDDTGQREERVYIAIAPVNVRTLMSLNFSDYARGVKVSDSLVYSIGVALPESELNLAFQSSSNAIEQDLETAAAILIGLVVMVSFFATLVSCLISISITKPVILLLGIVQSINAKHFKDKNIPPLKGGFREVNQVYNSFAKLYKAIRFSNTAFFSMNLKWAYKFLNDALTLFRKLDDEKAIGIASNNLGSALLAMYEERRSRFDCCEIDGQCMWLNTRECFDESIQIGIEAYSTVPDWKTNEEKANFAEQLADRHFNRALFLLLTKNDPCSPESSSELGYRDLITAKRLDKEAHNLRTESSTLVQSPNMEDFNRGIRRLRGLVKVLEEDNLFNDVWGIRDLIEETERILYDAWEEELPIFRSISQIGRLQQLECVVIRYELCYKNFSEAARIGMRMLVEDDFILEMPFNAAATALLSFMDAMDKGSSLEECWSAKTISLVKEELRKMYRLCKMVSSQQLGKNVFFYLGPEYDIASNVAEVANENIKHIVDDSCNDDDFIGFVRYENSSLPNCCLVKKKNASDEDIMFLSDAVSASGREVEPSGWPNVFNGLRRVVPLFIDPFIDRNGNDTWIVVLVHGDIYDNHKAAVSWICELNKQRENKIHLIIVGVDVDSDIEVDIFEKCCSIISKESTYIATKGNENDISKAFQDVDKILNGNINPGGLKIVNGVTMEKF